MSWCLQAILRRAVHGQLTVPLDRAYHSTRVPSGAPPTDMPSSPFLLDLAALPLFFRYRDVVFGRGFAATVETTGRALVEREGDDYVMAGVEPGGLAAGGATSEEARHAFRRTFTEVLFDLAADAPSFQAFKESVEAFAGETSPATVAAWTAAVADARRLVDSASDVARQPAGLEAGVVVLHVELAPDQNVVSEPEHLVAA